jgi:two-component system CheB/CheR fusion protein
MPSFFVINGRDEIVRFLGGEIKHYLAASSDVRDQNLFTIVRKDLRPAVRTALEKARVTQKAVVDDNLTINIEGQNRSTTLVVEPVGEGCAGAHLLLVAFRDVGPRSPDTRDKPALASDTGEQALQRELRHTRTRLQVATNTLKTCIADIKSAEEYQSVNEKLQAANEELASAKEEMQAINKQLKMINGELSAKNELLWRLNSDLQNFMDSTDIATIFLDDDLRIKAFTPAMMDIFPIREEDRGRLLTDFVSTIPDLDLPTAVDNVRRKHSLLEREVQVKNAGRTFLLRIRPYRTVDKRNEGSILTFADISDRKRSEMANAHLAAMVASTADAIISFSIDGRILSWNPGAEGLYGYNAHEAIGQRMQMLVPEQEANNFGSLISRIAQGECIGTEAVRRRKDGRLLDVAVELAPIRAKDGDVIAISVVARDITRRKLAEAALACSEERFRLLVEAAPNAMLMVDSRAHITQVNLQAEKLFGYQRNELLGQPVEMLVPERLRAKYHALRAAFLYTASVRPLSADRELFGVRKDGSEVPIEIRLNPLRIGEQQFILAAIVDISERKSREEQLLFITRELSHRTKNLLSVIQAIAHQTASSSKDLNDFESRFSARVQAVAQSQDLLVGMVRAWPILCAGS